jgi:hypothetical protein
VALRVAMSSWDRMGESWEWGEKASTVAVCVREIGGVSGVAQGNGPCSVK